MKLYDSIRGLVDSLNALSVEEKQGYWCSEMFTIDTIERIIDVDDKEIGKITVWAHPKLPIKVNQILMKNKLSQNRYFVTEWLYEVDKDRMIEVNYSLN